MKISNKSNNELDRLYNKRRLLRSQKNASAKEQLALLKDEIECIDSEDGGFMYGSLIKAVSSQLQPSNSNERSGRDIMTTAESIRKEAVKHYTNIFQDKTMEENIKHAKELQELFL